MAAVTGQPELGNTPAYQGKLTGLLGQRDPVDVLKSTPDFVTKLAQTNSREKLCTRPYAGKWTPTEIMGHLVDAEWVFGYRVRLILCEEKPVIQSMDQELWVVGQKYNEQPPLMLAEHFRSLRGVNLSLYERLSPSECARVGRHAERGEESLGLMLRMHAGHDLSHIDQLTRYVAAISAT
jgi:hypothetical protein